MGRPAQRPSAADDHAISDTKTDIGHGPLRQRCEPELPRGRHEACDHPGASRLWKKPAAAGCGDWRPPKTSAFWGVPQVEKGHGWQSCSARDVPSQMTGVGELFFRRGHRRPVWGVGPMPCRRTLFAALQAFAHSKRPALRHSLLRWPATPTLRARAPFPEYRVGI
jgi:hypothetical protein